MIIEPFVAPSVEAMTELLPTYEFVAIVASNEIEAVYISNQTSLDRHVAIKVYAPGISSDENFQVIFESTTRAMAKLNHVNLIGVYSSGAVGDMLYLAMEFVRGKSLAYSTKGTPLEATQVNAIMEGVCNGMAHAHEHHILHGGLTTDCILLNQKAEPKIGNFGLWLSVGDEKSDPKSRFRAPELMTEFGKVTVQSDIYALGVILYELLTGQEFSVGAKPASSVCGCSPRVDEALAKATAHQPSERYADVVSFWNTAKAVLPGAKAVPATGLKPAAKRGKNRQGKSAAPARPVQQIHHVGANWTLFRNILIIAALVIAIGMVWKVREKQAKALEVANQKRLAQKAERYAKSKAEAQQREAARKLLAEQNETKIVTPVEPEIVAPPEPLVQTTLDECRESLLAGKRDKMPAGSVQQGDCYFYLVLEPMTWSAASSFAQQYSAHLVVPSSTASLSWIMTTVAKDSPMIWLGAAKSGLESWTFADGLAWKPSKQPAGNGSYLAANQAGDLSVGGDRDAHPFVIQWHTNGSNPGSMESLLAATRASIASSNPVYPPGTQAFGVRNYLYVAQSTTWKDAKKIAQSSGGHLLVSSGVAESFNIKKMVDSLTAEQGIWIGGYLEGTKWAWVSGEPWKSPDWIEGVESHQPNSGLLVLPGQGWTSQNEAKRASGFIIEWSSDGGLAAQD